jgi:hypothetical protein
MSFESQLTAFVSGTEKKVERTVRAVKLELFRSVILDTPVDTGRARGNWQATLDSPATEETENESMSVALAGVAANLGKVNDVSFLANNLPYIEELEDGSSKQAPAGMVRRNMARVQRLINEQAARR